MKKVLALLLVLVLAIGMFAACGTCMDIHLAKPLDEAKMINALKQCVAERSAVKLRNDL